MKSFSLQIRQTLALFIVGTCITGFGSCSVPMSEICTARFPEFDARMGDAIAALGPWMPGAGRQPASAAEEMSRTDREAWQRWAEDRLVETQHYIDAATAEYAVARDALTDVANQLVAFHGYAGSGRSEKMVQSLQRIQKRSAEARELACARK